MMALHNLSDTEGVQDENGTVTLPAPLHPTRQSLKEDGVYLLENGQSLFMWIGKTVSPDFLHRVFGVKMLSQLNVTTGDEMLGLTGDPMSTKVANIIRQVRQGHPIPFMVLHIIPAGEPKEALFFSSLIIDWESTVSLQA